MDAAVKGKFLSQLDEIIETFSMAKKQYDSDPDNVYGMSGEITNEIVSRSLAAAARIGGRSSTYFQQIDFIIKSKQSSYIYVYNVVGIIKGLRYDIEKEYISSVEEIIHADIFANYLEMAEHLNKGGYKDAAAVIAGSTLESHIRQLCNKFGVPLSMSGKPKKSDTLNAELAKAGVYTLIDQKNVTAWLGLRNDAAHGNYANYIKEQVDLFVENIRDFIARHPA